jgi:hypothetical protein
MIQFIRHNEIDIVRWDKCIDRSVNRMPYASSWWLDAVCAGWEALVLDDYLAVMPLTRNRKLGIDYLYQPFFTQQLGVFSPERISSSALSDFLAAIPALYRYIDIQMNSGNHPDHKDFRYTSRKNYSLDLSMSYIRLASGYHRNCRRNIQKAVHSGLAVKPGPGPAIFTRFIQMHLDRKLTGKGKSFYPVLQKITTASMQIGTGKILGVYKPSGDLLAAGWFVQHAGRYTFLVCASTPAGKEHQAMYLLVDHAIREKASTELIFDFAGSNLPGVAYFNQGFGATESFYPAVKRNMLPWPLCLFKR